MCNKDTLIEFVYGEMPPVQRAAFEAHLASCAECRVEAEGLRGTRRQLGSWAPPEPQLDFRVVRGAGAAARRAGWVPAWGLAAAASLLIVAGAAVLANLELRYGPDGIVIRSGWAEPSRTAQEQAALRQAGEQTLADAETSEALKARIAALETRLRELEAVTAGERTDGVRTVAASGLSEGQAAAVSAMVRRMVTESEARQRAERSAQMAQVWSDFRAARASDFVRFHEALGRAQGMTNYQLQQHRDSIDSLVRVSLQK